MPIIEPVWYHETTKEKTERIFPQYPDEPAPEKTEFLFGPFRTFTEAKTAATKHWYALMHLGRLNGDAVEYTMKRYTCDTRGYEK
jgi:hypothetical protein